MTNTNATIAKIGFMLEKTEADIRYEQQMMEYEQERMQTSLKRGDMEDVAHHAQRVAEHSKEMKRLRDQKRMLEWLTSED